MSDWEARYRELIELLRESRPRRCANQQPSGEGFSWKPCGECASCRLQQLILNYQTEE